MKAITIALCLALAGCGTTSEPRIVVKEVKVPVAIKCAAKVDRPDLPDVAAAEKGAENIDVLARVYRAYYLLTVPYIAELEAANRACQ